MKRSLKKLRELDKEKLELDNQNKLLRDKAEKYEQLVKNNLNEGLAQRLKDQGEAEAELERNQKRADSASKAYIAKEDSARIKAAIEIMHKPFSPEEQEDINRIGQSYAERKLIEEQTKSINERRAADFQLAKVKAQKAQETSSEFNQLYNDLEKEEIETERLKREAHQKDLKNKAMELEKEAKLANDIQSQIVDDNLSASQQATLER